MQLNEINHLLDSLQSAEERDNLVLNLTANENIISKSASKYCSSIWSNRYHLGTQNDYGNAKESVDKGGLVFRGLPEIYALEKQAIFSVHSLFNAPKFALIHFLIFQTSLMLKSSYYPLLNILLLGYVNLHLLVALFLFFILCFFF